MRKTIGVLGGMGPAATVELFSRVVNNTTANNDSDHVKLIIINDPTIPDRTKYILGNGVSPIPLLKKNLNKLAYLEVDAVIIPCMTAHAFIPQLQQNYPIPIVNGIELIEEYLNNNEPNIEEIGLLATNGSIRSGVYQKYISRKIITPNDKNQEKLMDIIYGEKGIKAGNINDDVLNRLKYIIDDLKDNGAQAIIAGCTELGLVLTEDKINELIIDPITLLAKKAIEIGSIDYQHLKLKQ